jgi:hypothetical protein
MAKFTIIKIAHVDMIITGKGCIKNPVNSIKKLRRKWIYIDLLKHYGGQFMTDTDRIDMIRNAINNMLEGDITIKNTEEKGSYRWCYYLGKLDVLNLIKSLLKED